MLHARTDYNVRIQDSENKIGENEPVFLLRAQDKCMIPTLWAYLRTLRTDEDYDRDVELAILRHIERTEEWQRIKGKRAPDCPTEYVVSA